MQFAGITLTIRDDARREIQKDVDMLTQSPKHLNIKAERAKTYFPIIEKIFQEERIPDDFKYLVLQESALISDAVSVSNAVGFWQFKDFTAVEMGLRVDKEVDERMNIVSSSRAAAKYLKKNNYYFNNWVYALQAYQMGAGGVLKSVKDYESGTKHMEITSKTYWYVKKFLSHKIAFENAISGSGQVKVHTVINSEKKLLKELANEFSVGEEELQSYNTWIRKGYIPGDKAYTVAIPAMGDNRALNVAVAKANHKGSEPPTRVNAKPAEAKRETLYMIGILAMKASEGETITIFVKRADVDLSYFLKCNDLSISDKLHAGNFYYLKKKKAKGGIPMHVARPGDDLWLISQEYGVQLKKLQKYNRASGLAVKEGSVIYLTSSRTATLATAHQSIEVAEVDTETFNWSVEPEGVQASIESVPIEISNSKTTTAPVPLTDSSAITQERVLVNPDRHTVQPGETLYAIAKRYELQVMDIVQWNNLKLEEGIKPGQVIVLKMSGTTNQSPVEQQITHQVKASDTLYSVARQYGVTIKELMEWNQKKDFNLTVGENLKVMK
jgi:membrane-bound lytic murein transglycosylase D